MSICNPSSDGQAKTTAGLRLTLTKIGLVEAIKHALSHIFRHANARIPHCHKRIVCNNGDLGANLAMFRRISNCIVQEYSQQSLEEEFIPLDIHWLLR